LEVHKALNGLPNLLRSSSWITRSLEQLSCR